MQRTISVADEDSAPVGPGSFAWLFCSERVLQRFALSSVYRPWAGTSGGEVQKSEAEQDGGIAAVQKREKSALWKMNHPVRHGRLPRCDEGGDTAEQAQHDQCPAHKFNRSRHHDQRRKV